MRFPSELIQTDDVDEYQGLTIMTEIDCARRRAHVRNISRYQRLLESNLSELERSFVERRLSEERSQLRSLLNCAFGAATINLHSARDVLSHGK